MLYLPTIKELRALLEAKTWSAREEGYPSGLTHYRLAVMPGLVHLAVEHDSREQRVYWQVVAGGVIEKIGWTRSRASSQQRAVREGAKLMHSVLKGLYS